MDDQLEIKEKEINNKQEEKWEDNNSGEKEYQPFQGEESLETMMKSDISSEQFESTPFEERLSYPNFQDPNNFEAMIL